MAEHKASLLLEKQGKIEVGTRSTPTPKGKDVVVKITATASKSSPLLSLLNRRSNPRLRSQSYRLEGWFAEGWFERLY